MDCSVKDEVAAAEVVATALDEHFAMADGMHAMEPEIAQAASLVSEALAQGGKVLLCGNGGSAADAQHIAAELVGRFLRERRPLAAEALTINTSVLTAIGNDYSFEEVFARQVGALGRTGDVLIAISTSGNSPNVLRAAQVATQNKLKVIGLTGLKGGELKDICTLCLKAPSEITARIQEMHILVGHIICQLVEDELCSGKQ